MCVDSDAGMLSLSLISTCWGNRIFIHVYIHIYIYIYTCIYTYIHMYLTFEEVTTICPMEKQESATYD